MACVRVGGMSGGRACSAPSAAGPVVAGAWTPRQPPRVGVEGGRVVCRRGEPGAAFSDRPRTRTRWHADSPSSRARRRGARRFRRRGGQRAARDCPAAAWTFAREREQARTDCPARDSSATTRGTRFRRQARVSRGELTPRTRGSMKPRQPSRAEAAIRRGDRLVRVGGAASLGSSSSRRQTLRQRQRDGEKSLREGGRASLAQPPVAHPKRRRAASSAAINTRLGETSRA